MLLYSPTKIFRADFLIWNVHPNAIESFIFKNDENNDIHNISEIIIDANCDFELKTKPNSEYLFLPLFGKIQLNIYDECISANQVIYCKSNTDKITIHNLLSSDKADILILEKKSINNDEFIKIQDIDFRLKNNLNTILDNLGFPNFIGLYDGRQEDCYTLQNSNKNIFAFVLNGAFEFENRLLETRDALILTDTLNCHFEALSENALLLLLEIEP